MLHVVIRPSCVILVSPVAATRLPATSGSSSFPFSSFFSSRLSHGMMMAVPDPSLASGWYEPIHVMRWYLACCLWTCSSSCLRLCSCIITAASFLPWIFICSLFAFTALMKCWSRSPDCKPLTFLTTTTEDGPGLDSTSPSACKSLTHSLFARLALTRRRLARVRRTLFRLSSLLSRG